MKYFFWIYIFLYTSYVILGPHYISRLIRNDTLEIVDNSQTFISRIFFLSYISYLTSAYFFLNPNSITWIIAILVNISALLGYIIKWFPIREIDPYYWSGMISHILVILPLLFALKFFKIDILIFVSKDFVSKDMRIYQYLSIIVTIFLLIIYFIVQNNIYNDNKWKDYINGKTI